MVNANAKTVMEVWQEIRKNKERGAERLVAEYGNRLYAAAVLLCANDQEALGGIGFGSGLFQNGLFRGAELRAVAAATGSSPFAVTP